MARHITRVAAVGFGMAISAAVVLPGVAAAQESPAALNADTRADTARSDEQHGLLGLDLDLDLGLLGVHLGGDTQARRDTNASVSLPAVAVLPPVSVDLPVVGGLTKPADTAPEGDQPGEDAPSTPAPTQPDANSAAKPPAPEAPKAPQPRLINQATVNGNSQATPPVAAANPAAQTPQTGSSGATPSVSPVAPEGPAIVQPTAQAAAAISTPARLPILLAALALVAVTAALLRTWMRRQTV